MRLRTWLALLALALQLALPLWHMPAAAAGVLICTPQGLKLLPAGEDGGTPMQSDRDRVCPICQTAQIGANGILPTPVAASIPVAYVAVVLVFPTGLTGRLPAAPPPSSRAPPLQA